MSVGPWQIVIIVLVAVLVFGGKQLPRLGRQLGRGLGQLRRATRGGSDGEQPNWVAAVGEVRKVAKTVRKVSKMGRPF
jgi:sec-independent protein translocase protein TatA